MKYILPVIFIALVLASCQKQQPHLPPEKMRLVLADIFVAESYSMVLKQDSTRPGTQKDLDSLDRFYREIFQHHNITRREFESSMRWYEQHPEDLDSTFAGMVRALNRQPAGPKGEH